MDPDILSSQAWLVTLSQVLLDNFAIFILTKVPIYSAFIDLELLEAVNVPKNSSKM